MKLTSVQVCAKNVVYKVIQKPTKYTFINFVLTHSGYTVEPPNKGHFGNNINSAVLSLVERLSSSRRFTMYGNYRE